MSTQGKGTYVINSGWSSGSLVFYEKAVGRTATGDIFTIGASQVTVGGTGQDVDFLVYLGSANNYFKLDCGAATAAFYGVDVTVTGDLTIASEDLALGDDCSLEFGASTDVTMTWLGTSNILAILPATDDTGAIQFGNGTKDMDVKIFLGSASNYVDFNVGDTQMALVGVDITTGSPVVITDATATSSTTTGALIVTGGIATAADITCGDDLFMSNGGVINFNAGNVTITHSAGALACTGALTVSIGTESTSTTTGALIVTGGIGFGGDMYVGDDIFLTSGAVLNFDAGDVTLTHSANTLAIAGGGLTVAGTVGITVADQGLTVTCATLNATTGRIAKFDSTVLTPDFGDGYGAIECNLNIGTGAVAGFVAGASSWINLGVNTTTFSAGATLSPLDVGVWGTTGITMTNSKIIMGLKMSCVIDDGADPGELYLFNTNIFSNATTALFDINTIVDFAATASAASSGAYKLPFLKERSTGTVWYMNIYTS